jgi:hypothetical protein
MTDTWETTNRSEHSAGASPFYAPQQRSLLREPGFGRCEAFTIAECIAMPEDVRHMAGGLIELLSGGWEQRGWSRVGPVQHMWES